MKFTNNKLFMKVFLTAILLSSAVMMIKNQKDIKETKEKSYNQEISQAKKPTDLPLPTEVITVVPTISYPSYTPTPSPVADITSGWNVYTNDFFPLSFKYPSDWKLTKTDHNVIKLVNSNSTVYFIIADSKTGGFEYPYPKEQFGWGFKDYFVTIDRKDVIFSKSYIENKDAIVQSNVGKVNSSKDIFITFGTGAPGLSSETASQTNLDQEWETIMTILSTIEAGYAN